MDLRKEGSIPLKMLTCFLCDKAGILVKKFNEDKLEKCRKIQAFRKKKNLVYRDVVLPKSLQQKGYHLSCYDKFIILKRKNNQKEFDSLFSNDKVLINNIPPLKIESPKAFKKNTPSSSIIEIPKLIEIPKIGNKNCDIDLKVTPFKTYQMDEPSYVNPDIARGVILKSILTRKSPIKKDMMKDCSAFNSGMDLFRYGNMFNQPNLNFCPEKLEPKIVEPILLENACVFCDKQQKKIGTQVELPEILEKDECEKVLETARAMDDVKLLDKSEKNKEFLCHSLCKVQYKNKYHKITSKNCDENDRLVIKNLQNKAFEALCIFIDNEILGKNKFNFLSDLFQRYKLILFDIQNTTIPLDTEITILQLQEQILNHYTETIKITSKTKKKIVHKDGQTHFEIEDFNMDKLSFQLHSEIKSSKRKSDEGFATEIPEKLMHFIGCLIQGPVARDSFVDRFKIKSLCEDIVASVNVD